MRVLTKIFRPIPDWGYFVGLSIVVLGLAKCIYHLIAEPAPLATAKSVQVAPDSPIGMLSAWLGETMPDFVMLGVMSITIGISIMVLRVYERGYSR